MDKTRIEQYFLESRLYFSNGVPQFFWGGTAARVFKENPKGTNRNESLRAHPATVLFPVNGMWHLVLCRWDRVFPASVLDTRKQEFPRVSWGYVWTQFRKKSWIHNTEESQMKIVWCLLGSGSCTNEHECTVHAGLFAFWFFSAPPHSLPLSSPSGKNFVWGF